jgi:hypothetical protein
MAILVFVKLLCILIVYRSTTHSRKRGDDYFCKRQVWFEMPHVLYNSSTHILQKKKNYHLPTAKTVITREQRHWEQEIGFEQSQIFLRYTGSFMRKAKLSSAVFGAEIKKSKISKSQSRLATFTPSLAFLPLG